jgi:hypothetical protein
VLQFKKTHSSCKMMMMMIMIMLMVFFFYFDLFLSRSSFNEEDFYG